MIIKTQEETTLRIQELYRQIDKAKGKKKVELQEELERLRDEQIKQLKEEFGTINTQVDAVTNKKIYEKPQSKNKKLKTLIELNRQARELVKKTTMLKREIRG